MSDETLNLASTAVVSLASLAPGTSPGDVMQWSGTAWTSVPISSATVPLVLNNYASAPDVPVSATFGNLYKKVGSDFLYWATLGAGELRLMANETNFSWTSGSFTIKSDSTTALNIRTVADAPVMVLNNATQTLSIYADVNFLANASFYNSTSWEVSDNLVKLANGNGGDLLDIGFFGEYTSAGTKYMAIYRPAGLNEIQMRSGITTEPNNLVTTAGSTYSDLRIKDLYATNVTGTLVTASQPNVTTLVGVTTLQSMTVGATTIAGASSISSTAFVGTLSTASQPNITTLAGLTSAGTSTTVYTGAQINTTYFSSGNVSIGTPAINSKLTVYESTLYTGYNAGLNIVQGSTGDALLRYNAVGSRITTGIDSSDSYKYKIARGPSIDANTILTIDPNYTSSSTVVASWTSRSPAASIQWQSVCWASDLRIFVAVASSGTGNRVMTSPDGTTWTSRTSAADNSWMSICWAAELRLFVAVASSGTGNRVMTSANGTSWTIRTSAADNSWTSVCWAPELRLFCAVASSGTDNRVMTSPDGITWTTRTSAADNPWNSVCWASEIRLFCAVATSGTNNHIMTSPDGITWTTRVPALSNTWKSVCWSGEVGLFAAVASAGSYTQRVMTSPDGITWTLRESYTFPWNSICWSPEARLFMAIPLNDIMGMSSTDGITWTFRDINISAPWNSVCWSPELGIFTVVGSIGTYIVTSTVSLYSGATTTTIAGNLAATLSTASQPNITTLAGLTSANSVTFGSQTLSNLTSVTSTAFVGTLSTASQPNITTLAGLTTAGTSTTVYTGAQLNNVYFNNNNVSIGTQAVNSKLTVYESNTYTGTNAGLNIVQGSTGDALIQYEAYGSRITTGIDQSDSNKYKIARGPSVDANTLVTVDPNYPSSAVVVSTWTSRTSAADNQWRSICWSPELRLFCAVAITGTANRIMTSPNGITWTIRVPAVDNDWNAVCWSSELRIFCAVSFTGTSNRVMTSTNGITWTSRTSAVDNQWLNVCWSPELRLFCATSSDGTGNRVMTSPDGITWTSRTSAADNSWWGICWSPELRLFVATSTTGLGNRVMTSPDGITWTSRTSAADNQWLSVCWSSELTLFVAVSASGTGNRVMTSPDGITWTSRTSAADNDWSGVCWSSEASIFVAVSITGTLNHVMTSTNGTTWTTRTSTANNQWRSVCWSPELGIFAAVSSTGTGNCVMTSGNMYANRSTTTFNSDITVSGSSSDAIIKYKTSPYIITTGVDISDNFKYKISIGNAVDTNAVFAVDPSYSSSATVVSSWTLRNASVNNNWYGVCWAPELSIFCAVAQSGTGDRVMTSPDGVTWTTRTSAADNNWMAVCWAPEIRLFAAVGITGAGNRVMTSSDGITWTARASASDSSWYGICWSPELRIFCAVAWAAVATSPDGITWTSRTPANGNNWSGVCWAAKLGIFCAVAYSGATAVLRVMTSPDGINWTARSAASDIQWNSVCWSPELNLFCASGNGGGTSDLAMTSPDGVTWTIRSLTEEGNWFSVTWSAELALFIISGTGSGGGTIISSPNGINWTSRYASSGRLWRTVCWSPELGILTAVSTISASERVVTSSSIYASASPKIYIQGIYNKTTSLGTAAAVMIDSAGNLGTIASTITKKENIEPMGDRTNVIYDLTPVTFHYKPEYRPNPDEPDITRFGLIAEHVMNVLPELVVVSKKSNGEITPDTVAYHELPVMLLNELIKLKKKVDKLEQRLEELTGGLD